MKAIIRVVAAFAVTALGVTTLSLLSPAQGATTHAAATRAGQAARAHVGTTLGRARCHVPRCYGAISVSPDQAYGWYNDARTRSSAVRKAQRHCKAESNYPGYCRKLGSIGNGCMAVAIKTDSNGWITKWASGFARTLAKAKRHAKHNNGGGRIRAALCTTRRY
ncbi:MAG: DUF4189 domain-containing protein [Nocardioides sp.]|uniref:DUF4189 domain-containing protein n=1 Tax=Nocardioides sp. TaxID=35761 RepID=UPI0039E4621B